VTIEASTTAAIRRDIADACHVLALYDQGDFVWGHVSARDPDGRGTWMKASGLGFEEVDPENTVLIDREGAVIEGTGRRHLEYPIHTEVLAARDDMNAVVHTHAANVVALAALDVPLRAISHDACMFGPDPVPRFTRTGGLITSPELGAAVAETLGDALACMLVHHGIVVVGRDVPNATIATVILDRACAIQLRAMSAGRLATWSSDKEVLEKREQCYSEPLILQAWEYAKRRTRAIIASPRDVSLGDGPAGIPT
jgi:L-fuculose-phosphate aldolase